MLYIFFELKKEGKINIFTFLFILLGCYLIFVVGKLFTIIINPDEINILKAGLTSYGGAIGLIISCLIFEKLLPFEGKLIKYSIISLPLMYGLSKIACFLAGCCYGIPYDGMFSVTYVDDLNISLFPVQLLESLVFIIIFLVINKFKENKNIIYISIITMSLFKFLLDFLRYENYIKKITTNQILSLSILIVTLLVMIFRKKGLYGISKTFSN